MTNELRLLWADEPDAVYFEYEGFKCAIFRVEGLGHLCGYVGVSDLTGCLNEDEISVHGGVTFYQPSENVHDDMKEHFENCDKVIGFDTGHYMDLVPSIPSMGGTYRDVFFVRTEIENMVKQLIELGVESEMKTNLDVVIVEEKFEHYLLDDDETVDCVLHSYQFTCDSSDRCEDTFEVGWVKISMNGEEDSYTIWGSEDGDDYICLPSTLEDDDEYALEDHESEVMFISDLLR